MTLEELLREDLIKPQATSPGEIAALWQLVERDLTSAVAPSISLDWQFAISYHAVLQLAAIIVRCEGYRPTRSQHFATLAALEAIVGDELRELVAYFQTCRVKRNITEYDRAGEISEDEVQKLLATAKEFREWVLGRVRAYHPDLAPPV